MKLFQAPVFFLKGIKEFFRFCRCNDKLENISVFAAAGQPEIGNLGLLDDLENITRTLFRDHYFQETKRHNLYKPYK